MAAQCESLTNFHEIGCLSVLEFALLLKEIYGLCIRQSVSSSVSASVSADL